MSYQLFESQVLQPNAKEGDFGCQRRRYKPQRWMRRMSERRGKFRLQSRRESDKAIGRDNFLFFSSFVFYGADKFLPHHESVFPC